MTQRYIDNPYPDFTEGDQTSFLNGEEYIKRLIATYVGSTLDPRLRRHDERGNLYVGSAGIAYMFWKLATSPRTRDICPQALTHASDFIQAAKEKAEQFKKKPGERFSFVNGNAGIYAVAAVISQACGDPQELAQDLANFKQGLSASKAKLHTPSGCDEVLEGRAGYLAGCYWLNDVLAGKIITDEEIVSICHLIVASGREASQSTRGPMPLMYTTHGTQYLGASHGLAGIMHMLLDSPWFRKTAIPISATMVSDIKGSIDFIVGLQTEEGNYPCSLEDVRYGINKGLHQWCHGAPGLVYMLAKAYLVFHEDKYLKALRRCADLVWKKGILYKGPGLCHGVSGNGYVFLLLYRLTKEPKQLYRAHKFMLMLSNPMFYNVHKSPDHPQSLFEGWAGAICFLIDLLEPDRAAFPFMDVFHD
ncbi:GL19966 [Drosophila persimilis]|uniref:LanC-like protein 3 homolog n=1 Tax=Drosophila persimilis TaxID=7234 RepID=B4GYQ2_DROPE|nr:lanC-like protein 3 homolog [Drosophila persimilis]EDW27908.1 GL19966 [Drosophila persimilis]